MRNKRYFLLLLAVVTMLLYPGVLSKAEAAGTIRSLPNDVLAGSDQDLGILIFEVPEGALTAGDTFILELPDNFYFNDSQPVAIGDDINSTVPSVVNVVYPPTVAGSTNSITGNITADHPGNGQLRVTLTADTDLTKKSFLYVYLRGVTVPSGYRGDIQIDITGNGGWPTSIEDMGDTQIIDQGQAEIDSEIKEPGNEDDHTNPIKVESTFKIGERSFTVNGQTIEMDVAPFLKNGRTFVPIRYVAKAAGVPDESISYENDVVTLKLPNNTVTLVPNSDVMLSEGKKIKMDTPVLLESGRTYLPLRWVCEALKLEVIWVEESQSIIIQN